jgi:Fe-Mn family superoxide dismutase
MAFKLPDLAYAYDALEPYIDTRTMEIHHSKHHSAYTNNLNAAVSGTAMENLSIDELIKNVSKYPVAVRNNGGGYFNHTLFWKFMKPKGGGQPTGALLEAIKKSFGSFDDFRKQFTSAAATRFGSGWAWLVKTPSGLVVTSTPNQDNPLMDLAEVKGVPVLTIDVWEHAYYLKYQNRRPEYIEAFWNVINWDFASEQFKS